MFYKISFLKIFARKKFTRKRLCWSLFSIEFQPFRPATLLKRDSNRCFPVKFAELLSTSFYRTPPMAASKNYLENPSQCLTQIRLMLQPYKNQSIHLQCRSNDWFLYECNNGMILSKESQLIILQNSFDFFSKTIVWSIQV